MEASYSGSAKRAKAPGNVSQVAHCLVDGCNADLSVCRDYHRRHKVCEIHSKTPKVTIGGREQRFCQQCSRFHSLVEFDEGKRSCRKRLDGHNRRRRKPQPDSLSRNHGLAFSTQQSVAGTTRFLSFTNQQVLPSTVVGSTWSGIIKAENELLLYNNQPQPNFIDRPNTFPECSSRANQLHFMQAQETASICQPLLDPTNAVSGSSSNRALSLLSSTREFSSTNHGVQTETTPLPPLAQPLLNNLSYSSLSQYQFLQESSKPVVSASDSHTLHFPEMFQQVPDGSSIGGPNQTLTFTWE